MKKEIAIIGYGRFGKFAACHLKKYFTVFVADRKPGLRVDPGIRRVALREAAHKPAIILAVPINQLPSTLREIAPYLLPGSLVLDVCSVKERPVEWMKKCLPGHCFVLATHPLFGPDSAAKTLKGQKIFLHPVRIPAKNFNSIATLLKKTGLIVHSITPRRHDQLMASTLFLTQLVGRGLLPLVGNGSEIGTDCYRAIVDVANVAGRDSVELFRDMYKYNRYARRIPLQVIKNFQQLIQSLSSM